MVPTSFNRPSRRTRLFYVSFVSTTSTMCLFARAIKGSLLLIKLSINLFITPSLIVGSDVPLNSK